jgi:deoxyribodipyrimidine photo-lyase
MVVIYWVRRDFRLRDNAALQRAKALGLPVLPVYIYTPDDAGPWGLGSASKWWLHQSLSAFAEALKEHGLSLLVEKGEPAKVLSRLIKKTGATHLVFNRLYEPTGVMREREVIELAASHGCDCESYPGGLLFEPGTLMTKEGNPYKVFTPFWNTAVRLDIQSPFKEIRGELKGKLIRGEGLSIGIVGFTLPGNPASRAPGKD